MSQVFNFSFVLDLHLWFYPEGGGNVPVRCSSQPPTEEEEKEEEEEVYAVNAALIHQASTVTHLTWSSEHGW